MFEENAAYFNFDCFRKSPIPIESEIKSFWKNCSPFVSIICLAYNQEKYIEDAIKGFLLQKTNFPFEIIIHDDASSDSTKNIIKKYHDMYPNIIKYIFQNENKYSQCPNSVLQFATSIAKGDYLALCEGDDFWISEWKLQNQINLLEKNPSQNICFHLAYSGSTDNGEKIFLPKFRDKLFYPNSSTVLSPEEVIYGDGGFMPTASIILRTAEFTKMPKWFAECPVGDYFIQVICSNPYGALFLPKPMSFYRVGSVGSWSEKVRDKMEEKINYIKKMHTSILEMNLYFQGVHYFYLDRMRSNHILFSLSSTSISVREKMNIIDAVPPVVSNDRLIRIAQHWMKIFPNSFQRMCGVFRIYASLSRLNFYIFRNLKRRLIKLWVGK